MRDKTKDSLIINDYLNLIKKTDISKSHSIPVGEVDKILKENNVTPQDRNEIRDKLAIHDYMNHISKAIISKKFDLSITAIDKILVRNKISRPRIENKQKVKPKRKVNIDSLVISDYINNIRKCEISKNRKVSTGKVNRILSKNNISPENRNKKPKKSYYTRKEKKLKIKLHLEFGIANPVIQDYINNITKTKISKTHQLSLVKINEILKENNISKNDQNEIPKKVRCIEKVRKPRAKLERDLAIARLYNEGVLINDISKLYGFSKQRAYQILKATGVKKIRNN